MSLSKEEKQTVLNTTNKINYIFDLIETDPLNTEYDCLLNEELESLINTIEKGT